MFDISQFIGAQICKKKPTGHTPGLEPSIHSSEMFQHHIDDLICKRCQRHLGYDNMKNVTEIFLVSYTDKNKAKNL